MEFEARIDVVESVQKANLFHFLTIIVDVSERGHEGGIGNTSVGASDAVGILAKQVIHYDSRSGRMTVLFSDVSTKRALPFSNISLSCNGYHLRGNGRSRLVRENREVDSRGRPQESLWWN